MDARPCRSVLEWPSLRKAFSPRRVRRGRGGANSCPSPFFRNSRLVTPVMTFTPAARSVVFEDLGVHAVGFTRAEERDPWVSVLRRRKTLVFPSGIFSVGGTSESVAGERPRSRSRFPSRLRGSGRGLRDRRLKRERAVRDEQCLRVVENHEVRRRGHAREEEAFVVRRRRRRPCSSRRSNRLRLETNLADRSVESRSGYACTVNLTLWPFSICPMSFSSTSASICIFLRSFAITKSSGAWKLEAIVCPASTERSITVPEIGERIFVFSEVRLRLGELAPSSRRGDPPPRP